MDRASEEFIKNLINWLKKKKKKKMDAIGYLDDFV